MEQPQHRLTMADPVVFRICVQGVLDQDWSNYFAAQAVGSEIDQAGNPVTVLLSEPIDQGAMVGLINRLNALGIPVISVEYVLDS